MSMIIIDHIAVLHGLEAVLQGASLWIVCECERFRDARSTIEVPVNVVNWAAPALFMHNIQPKGRSD